MIAKKKKIITGLNVDYQYGFYSILLIVSVILIIWAFFIFRYTVIHPKVLIATGAVGTIFLLLTLVIQTRRVATFSYPRIFLFSIMIGGGFSDFGLLYLNETFSNSTYITEKFRIEKTGKKSKGRYTNCERPFTIISFDGIEKEIVFDCESASSINQFSHIYLTYRRGFLGYAVINEPRISK